MNVVVNGEDTELADGTTVGQLVDARAEDRRGVAVAVNSDVVPRGELDDTALSDGDRVELVGAVQGG